MTDTQILKQTNITAGEYDIYFEDWNTLIHQIENPTYSQVLVITDENTEKQCLHIFFEKIDRQLKVISIPPGENNKTLETCQIVYQKMVQKNIDRDSLVVLVGGGVVGDLGGFCSTTYMRGLPFIYIPTSLLSQVDASIGGKLGVDFKELKNIIGVFQNPEKVFIFKTFLKTLPAIEVRNGFAEILKHWLIADKNSFQNAPTNMEGILHNVVSWVKPSILTKLSITEQDPKEKGLRKILNFGHTIGHAVETYSLIKNTPLLHGESIAIGMICESYISYRMNLLSEEEIFQIRHYIITLFGHHPKWVNDPEMLVDLMYNDKKNRSGKIRFSLLEGIGKAVYNWEVPEDVIYECLYFYKQKL
ncbi:MAG: 3-dehydroquinate synthase [Saprospiraceae bacterium]